MPAKKAKQALDFTTEAKIKTAARIVFHKKGYAAARTRDIAKKAGVNLALLNYYFHSKEELFQLIMFETVSGFFQSMGAVYNVENTTLEKKIELIAEKYIDLFTKEPEMPLFMMSEIRSNGAAVLEKLPVAKNILQSAFIKQYKEAVLKGKITEPNPLHFMVNLIGLMLFPFISSPIVKKTGKLTDKQFDKLMQERKKKIPIWVKAMFKAK